MLWSVKPNIAIIHCPEAIHNKIKEDISSIVNNITFLEDIDIVQLLKVKPGIVLFFSTDDLEYLLSQIQKLRSEQKFFRTIAVLIEKNPTFLRTRISLETGFHFILPFDKLNQLKSVLDVYTDIAEYQYIHDSNTWEYIFNFVNQPIIVCSNNGTIYFSNTRADILFNKTKKQLAGHSIFDLIAPSYSQSIQQTVEEVYFKNINAQRIPIILKSSREEPLFCLVSISRFPQIEKERPSLIFSFVEYSYTKKIENKSSLFQSVLDKSSNSILITNAKGTILYANERFLDHLKLRHTSLISRSSEILPAQYQLHNRKDAQLYTKLGYTFFNQTQTIHKSGNIIQEKEKIIPVHYNEEKKEGFLIWIAEYSKVDNIAKKTQTAWFDNIISETQKQLQALKINSHNISTNESIAPDKHDHMFQQISRSLELIKEYTHIQAKHKFVFSNIDINEMITEVVELFPEITNHIELRLQANLPRAFIDKSKIQASLIAFIHEITSQSSFEKLYLSTSIHKKGIQLVIRYTEEIKDEPKNRLFKEIVDQDLWIVQQIFKSHHIKFRIEQEFAGNAVFCFIPSINDNMDYKKQEKLALL